MKNFLRHFKLALIVTPIVIVMALVVGVAIVTQIKDGDAKKRGELLGQGMGIAVMVLIFPFWIYGAAQFGKERREALEKAKKKKTKSRPKLED